MNRYRLRALRPLTIDGQSYAAGDEFTVSADTSGVLLVRGQAELASSPARSRLPVALPTPRRRGRPRKVRTEGDPPARTYRRRDLQAEE